MQEIIKKIFADALRAAGNEAAKFFRRQIAQGQDIHGNRLTPRRYEDRRRRGKGVLRDRGNLYDSIRILQLSPAGVRVGIQNPNVLPYARLHNEGGNITVTPRMKRFFWAMYYDTQKRQKRRRNGTPRRTRLNQSLNDDAQFYKAMALKKAGSTIHIPQRQFLGASPLLKQHLEKQIQMFINHRLNSL